MNDDDFYDRIYAAIQEKIDSGEIVIGSPEHEIGDQLIKRGYKSLSSRQLAFFQAKIFPLLNIEEPAE